MPVQHHLLHLVPARLGQWLRYCITDLKFWLALMMTENSSMLKTTSKRKPVKNLWVNPFSLMWKLKLERKKEVKECIINQTRSTHDNAIHKIFQYLYVWHWPITREPDYHCNAHKWLSILTYLPMRMSNVRTVPSTLPAMISLFVKQMDITLSANESIIYDKQKLLWVNIISSLHNKYKFNDASFVMTDNILLLVVS